MEMAYKISVWLENEGTPHVYDARNTYVKGPFFCIHFGEKAHKYPIAHIWRVEEEYPEDTVATHKQVGQ
jgi:hypothetical protein